MANHRADKRAVKADAVDVRGTLDDSRGHPARRSVPSTEPVMRPGAGRRKAVRPTRSRTGHGGARKPLLKGLPSAPTLVGVAAMALAAAGAVTVSAPESTQVASGNLQRLSAQASVLSGASGVGSSGALSGRQRAVSRDSQRQAMQDAADEELQAAAERQARQRKAALVALAASAEKQASLIAKNAWQLPVTRGVYHLTSRFGDCSGLWAHCHTGLDFAAPTGTPIHAIAAGVISSTGYDGSYGNKTVETLGDGTELWYAHQSAFGVTTGQKVLAGQVIGRVGATGNVTGPHVHLEVRPGAGDPVDPYQALVARGLHP